MLLKGATKRQTNRRDWKKSFRRGRAGSGDGRDILQVRAVAEFLDQLDESLKWARGQRITARVGAKTKPANGARSPFSNAHSAISAERFAGNCARVLPVNACLFGVAFLSRWQLEVVKVASETVAVPYGPIS